MTTHEGHEFQVTVHRFRDGAESVHRFEAVNCRGCGRCLGCRSLNSVDGPGRDGRWTFVCSCGRWRRVLPIEG